MDDRYCDVGRFATTLEEILTEVNVNIDAQVPKAVRKGTRVGRDEVVKNSKSLGFNNMDGKTMTRYVSGWRGSVKDMGKETAGVIHNKDVPGLAHLLEKGHARIGGGRVEGEVHIAEAADKAFVVFEELIIEAVNKAL